MTPIYLNPSPTSFAFEELNHAQQDQGDTQEENKYVSRDEPSDQTEQSDGNSGLKLSTCKHEIMVKDNEERSTNSNVLSVKWMSSKMRLMKKMMNNTVLDNPTHTTSSTLDTDISSNNSSNMNTIIRTCSDCNTTKTPLWRSGPRGPKSLCNACGIRQRKARRAMAAAQAEAGGDDHTIVASETSSTSASGSKMHIKAKRCKLTARRNQKKLCFEDLALSLSKNSAFHQAFPQDEIREGAILLMALSCGLAHG